MLPGGPRTQPEVVARRLAPCSWARHLRCEAGQDLVEYLLLLSLIAVALILVVTGLGGELDAFYQRIVANLAALI